MVNSRKRGLPKASQYYVEGDIWNIGCHMNALRPARLTQQAVADLLAPSFVERLMRLKGDLRLGLPVVLTAGADAALVVPLETIAADRFAAITSGAIACDIVLTRMRAAMLGFVSLPDTDVVLLPCPPQSGLDGVMSLADPGREAARPALYPVSVRDHQPVAGGAIHHAAIAAVKSAQLLPAVLVQPVPDGQAEAMRLGLTVMAADDVLRELASARGHHAVSAARLPMSVSDAGRLHVFRPDDGGSEHYAIEIGNPDISGPVLVRLHSACFTGDVMGSLKCDCGPQLHAACATMAAAGGGVLLYLNQEGRGIGLANKMRAYALQDRGLDTVEANHHLGFDDDERDFRIGSTLLARLGIASVRLMTNNPAKVAMLRAQGINVIERVPLQVGRNALNDRYLDTKAAKSGHLLK
jgi:GTP cyclohydrolase II